MQSENRLFDDFVKMVNGLAGTVAGVGVGLSLEQAEAIAAAAVEECERFYPVFQFVLWGGKSPGEAIAAALIDTHGEA